MSEVPQDNWFCLREGQRIGPLSFADLNRRASEGLLHPQSDLVWTVGMEAWRPAGEISGLFEQEAPPPGGSDACSGAAKPDGTSGQASGQVGADSAREAWFCLHGGQRIGPLGFADLKLRASGGQLDALADQVWTVGMDAWKPAGEIAGLFDRETSESEDTQVAMSCSKPEDSSGSSECKERGKLEKQANPEEKTSPEEKAPSGDEPTLEEERAAAGRLGEAPHDAWFYTREGERIGPLSFGELKIRVAEGLVHPRTDLAWTVGMETWKPAGEIEGLFERRTSEGETKRKLADSPDPYEPGVADMDGSPLGQNLEWAGFGRGLYFLCSILLGVASAVLPVVVAPYAKGYEQFLIAIPILVAVMSVWLVVKRLNNVGMSGWWFLASFVPLLNFWISYRICVCPPGYAYHKKLDGFGIFLAILYWLMMLSLVLSMVGLFLILVKGAGDPQIRQQILDAVEKAQQGGPAR